MATVHDVNRRSAGPMVLYIFEKLKTFGNFEVEIHLSIVKAILLGKK